MKKLSPDNSTSTRSGFNAGAKAKKALFAAASILAGIILLEMVSCLLLLIFFRHDPDARFLLSNFPAQIRGRRDSFRAVFASTPMITAFGNDFLTPLNFDPAMGFRDEKSMVKMGPADANFRICTLGGSTTAGGMWPVYLEKYARLENVSEKIAVLNAGVPGYMSFNQQIFLSGWVMGQDGNKCDAVVSMDGVNDVYFRTAAYFYTLKNGGLWIPAYHAFQHKMELDVKNIQTTRGAIAQLGRTIAASGGDKWVLLSRTIPYTTRLLLEISIRVGEKRSAAFTEKQRRMFRFTGNNELILPTEIEDRIMKAWRSSVLDLAGSCRMRGIKFVDYLQPVLLDRYYPAFAAAHKDKPNFANQTQRNMGHDFDIAFGVDVRPTYLKSEAMYADLQRMYPDNFGSLIFLFRNNPNPGLYTDTVHCSAYGSNLIAQAVVKDLIARNILHRAGK